MLPSDRIKRTPMLRRVLSQVKRDLIRMRSLSVAYALKRRYELPVLELHSIVNKEVEIDPPILDHICLPPYRGTKDHDDFLPLMVIAKWLEPRIVLELGTGYGNLTANLCKQCTNVKVYTVNASVEEQTGTLISYKLAREEIGRVYRQYGFADQVVQIFKNTLALDLSEYFEAPIVDLAIIDACHDTNYVINDFVKVVPFVRYRGVVLLHDTHPSMRGHLLGSYLACMKLRAKGFDIRYIANTWWAIWIKGG